MCVNADPVGVLWNLSVLVYRVIYFSYIMAHPIGLEGWYTIGT